VAFLYPLLACFRLRCYTGKNGIWREGMNLKTIRKILKDTDFVHFSAAEEELQVAKYLQEQG